VRGREAGEGSAACASESVGVRELMRLDGVGDPSWSS
jgi:hypothetical protein